MWLIDTSTRELVEFGDPPVGAYAILSHTWGDAVDEVSMQEYREATTSTTITAARPKPGYAKIEQTCRLALQSGLAWAWVDTCCIDKTSSAELSEAINSMFRWYRDAAFCIAYLADLPHGGGLAEDLGRCRWFTRGWTLQELIAPRELEFYDEAWAPRGRRSALAPLLATVTGIDIEVLRDSTGLPGVPIARRMSWAAARTTKRLEDAAYCLLGLFDVNMPMLYGEGSKAFLRLQEEIARGSGDLSLFAWTAPGEQKYRGLFATSPQEFASARRLKHRIKGLCVEKEFVVTNRGLKIFTTLVSIGTDDVVLPLGVSDRDDWPRYTTDGWMGVYLSKTPNGYVRHRPQELYVAMWYRGIYDGPPVVTVRKTVDAAEAKRLADQLYMNSVHFRPRPSLCRVQRLVPEHLWDSSRFLFLDHSQGINAYAVLELYPFGIKQAAVQAIVACSTMTAPVCTFCIEGDREWLRISQFLETRTEHTDYVAADFLPRYFPSGSLLPDVVRKFENPKTKETVSITLNIERFYFEGSPAYQLELEAHPIDNSQVTPPKLLSSGEKRTRLV